MTNTVEFKYSIGDIVYKHILCDDIIMRGRIYSCIFIGNGVEYEVEYPGGLAHSTEPYLFENKEDCLKDAKELLLILQKKDEEREVAKIKEEINKRINSIEISCKDIR